MDGKMELHGMLGAIPLTTLQEHAALRRPYLLWISVSMRNPTHLKRFESNNRAFLNQKGTF